MHYPSVSDSDREEMLRNASETTAHVGDSENEQATSENPAVIDEDPYEMVGHVEPDVKERLVQSEITESNSVG